MTSIINELGSVTAVIGAQWGDEGKGKITDMLSEHFDVVARGTGGANAGHTVVVGGQKFVFHLLPSGCLHPEKQVVVGSGVLVHLPTLLEEIITLEDAGIEIISRLHLSGAMHIVFEFHKAIDAALEEKRSQEKGEALGTTKRGIGPVTMDKVMRWGMRLGDLLDGPEAVEAHLKKHAKDVKHMFGVKIDVDQEMALLHTAVEKIHSCVTMNAPGYLHEVLQQNKSILIEGAQATLLDIDHGTYPHVTSSPVTLAGTLHGLGLAPGTVTSCIGVAKAYCTRVGSGAFPTEIHEEDANRLRERGGEYGATTGRPRRCGWLDISDLKYAAMINGYTHWNITKLDVLDEEMEIPVGMGTNSDGSVQFKKLPGWRSPTVGTTEFAKLPENAQKYIQFIEEQTGIPVSFVGTGQGREEMVVT